MNPKYDKLTSVKVNSELFDSFKIESIKKKLTFGQLVNRALKLYVKDEDFRKQIHETI